MKIEILGTGGANTPEYGNTSFLIWNDEESEAVLMDCGYMVYPQLKERERISERDIISKIKSVGISHLHNDHAGSIGALLIHRWYFHKEKIKLSGVETLPEYMKLIESGRALPGIDWFDDRIRVIPTSHEDDMPSCALYFNGVLYSGDTNTSILTTPEAKKAKIIIHEARLSEYPSHMLIDRLAESAPANILAKTWLIHYPTRAKDKIIQRAKELGFAGVCTQGQIIHI